jgi:hypothetical protein
LKERRGREKLSLAKTKQRETESDVKEELPTKSSPYL